MNFSWLIRLLISTFKPFANLLSENIKNELQDFIRSLYQKALATENIWDDFFVKILADILSIDLK